MGWEKLAAGEKKRMAGERLDNKERNWSEEGKKVKQKERQKRKGEARIKTKKKNKEKK